MIYPDVPVWISLAMIGGGLAALAWSSDLFVDGAARFARALGITPFIVGMVVVGFGTSAPELCVSVLSGLSGHSEVSLGNAYGSCIFNIAVILGVSAFICPLVTRPSTTFVAGPALALISLFSYFVLRDGECSTRNAFVLLAAFAVLMPLYCWYDQKMKARMRIAPAETSAPAQPERKLPVLASSAVKLAVGLLVLVGSSHLLVWGSIDLAKAMGVSDLVIGLTIVAAGTSLPELASAIASARRKEHELVLGNILGSNFFNMLAVVGLACAVSPVEKISPYVLCRDLPINAFLSLSLLLFGVNWRRPKGRGLIRRNAAIFWLLAFVAYTVLLFVQEKGVAQ